MRNDEIVNVRYMVDDVDEALAFYTKFLDCEPVMSAGPAFAAVKRGNLRLMLAGPTSSAGRPMPDGTKPGPGGWNRIHFIVDDLNAESPASVMPAPGSATTSSKDPVVSRSCCRTPPATSSNCSNPRTRRSGGTLAVMTRAVWPAR